MVKYNYFYLMLICLLGLTTHAQKVSNITFKQEQSNIVVSYDLETKTPCKVSLYVSINNGATWQGPLKKVTGNVGDKIVSGNHSIVWKVLEEFQELSGTNIKFQVRANEEKPQSISSINKQIIKNPIDAKLYKIRGDIKHELDDTDGAIADYTKAISLNPKYADAYKARGKLMYSNYNAAISDYSKAISLNPKDAYTFYDRANAKSGLQDYKGAISDYSKALELEPNNTKFLFAKARAKRNLNDNIGAIEDSNQVIELDSTFENIYYFRGINKYDLDDIEGANYDFEKEIKNNSNPIYEYNRIADWRWNNNDYKAAIVYFTKAIEILPKPKPNNTIEVDTVADVYYNYLGRAFSKYKLKDFVGANSDFDKFVELSDDKAYANKEIAVHYKYSFKELGDFENAIKYLNKAINITPKEHYFENRAELKIELKDYQAAIEDYSKAIEKSPNAYYYNSRADIKIELEDYRGAIEDYTKAIKLKPDASNFSGRASAKFSLLDYRGAIVDYSKAIELDSKQLFSLSNYYYFDRGNAKFNIGDYKGAIADYSKVILLDPKNGGAYLWRGNAKKMTKDKKGACKDFSKAGELGEDEAYKSINEHCNK